MCHNAIARTWTICKFVFSQLEKSARIPSQEAICSVNCLGYMYIYIYTHLNEHRTTYYLQPFCSLFFLEGGGDNFQKKVFSQYWRVPVPGILLPHIESWPGTLYWRYLVLLPNQVVFQDTILPESKIAPEHGWLEDENWFWGLPFFSGSTVDGSEFPSNHLGG